jgi:hypothetical protein
MHVLFVLPVKVKPVFVPNELFCRRVLFDLMVEGEPFIVGLDSLEQSSYFNYFPFKRVLFDLPVKVKPVFCELFCRRVLFDLVVEGEPFIVGLESLEQALAAFVHVCFVAQMNYPQVELLFWPNLNHHLVTLEQTFSSSTVRNNFVRSIS